MADEDDGTAWWRVAGCEQDVFALIAYEDPETSPVRQYMAEDYKDTIALRVNSAILGT
jgi:hypothetical protein